MPPGEIKYMRVTAIMDAPEWDRYPSTQRKRMQGWATP